MTTFLQQTLNALQLGSIYALIALGYTMVFGILGFILAQVAADSSYIQPGQVRQLLRFRDNPNDPGWMDEA